MAINMSSAGKVGAAVGVTVGVVKGTRDGFRELKAKAENENENENENGKVTFSAEAVKVIGKKAALNGAVFGAIGFGLGELGRLSANLFQRPSVGLPDTVTTNATNAATEGAHGLTTSPGDVERTLAAARATAPARVRAALKSIRQQDPRLRKAMRLFPDLKRLWLTESDFLGLPPMTTAGEIGLRGERLATESNDPFVIALGIFMRENSKEIGKAYEGLNHVQRWALDRLSHNYVDYLRLLISRAGLSEFQRQDLEELEAAYLRKVHP